MKLLTFLLGAVALFFAEDKGSIDIFERFAVLGVVINQESLKSTYTSFRTVFKDAYTGANTVLEKLAVIVPSVAKQEEYKWLGQFPGLREWVGERVVKDLSVDGFIIKNRDFEATISVDRNDIEDENIGLYKPLFQQLGETARQHPDSLMYDLLINGFTSNSFDGTTFFATDHPNGKSANWSNMGTAVLDVTSYANARAQMMSLTNEEGRPLKVVPNYLIVAPQLEATARALLRADKSANGETNIWQKSADLIIAPELVSNPTYWFLADLKKAAKPLIFQSRREANFVGLDNIKDENVFMHKEYIYGVDYRGNAGYGLPHLIYASNGTV